MERRPWNGGHGAAVTEHHGAAATRPGAEQMNSGVHISVCSDPVWSLSLEMKPLTALQETSQRHSAFLSEEDWITLWSLVFIDMTEQKQTLLRNCTSQEEAARQLRLHRYGFITTAASLRLRQHRYGFIATASSLRLHRYGYGSIATASSLRLRQHRYGFIATASSLRQHRYGFIATATAASLRLHHYGFIATAASLRQHRYGSIATAASLRQHRYGFIATAASLRQHRYGSIATASSLRQHRYGSIATAASLRQHRYGYGYIATAIQDDGAAARGRRRTRRDAGHTGQAGHEKKTLKTGDVERTPNTAEAP
ncbi:uncharacterized protein V6R79_019350 [Siganus canaliculatus]